MNTYIKILIAFVVIIILGVITTGFYVYNVAVNEADLRTAIEAKHEDNLNEYSNMKSKIKQSAQVSDKEAEVIAEVIANYTEGRGSGGGTLFKAVSEAVPNVDVKTLQNLQNIIVGSRDSWTQRQKELVSLSQSHNQLLNRPLSGFVCRIIGKEKIDIKIVATAQSTQDFETETETEEDLF